MAIGELGDIPPDRSTVSPSLFADCRPTVVNKMLIHLNSE